MSEVQERSGGRQKSIELNLVPFIDLMSVLITFLLLSAVWTQISLIQIGSSVYGKRNFDPVMPPPAENEVVLKLEVREIGYALTMGMQTIQIPKSQGLYDDVALGNYLNGFKQKYPQKTSAAIAVADELPYERLIKGMDAFIKAGFPTLDVLTGGP